MNFPNFDRVRFFQTDVWEGYVGHKEDTVEVEIFQPWLLPASQAELEAQRSKSSALSESLAAGGSVQHGPSGVLTSASGHNDHGSGPAMGHHHHHHDDHDEGHDHVHEGRAEVELKAVEKEVRKGQL